MKKFTDAGLKIGLTIRAQQATLVDGVWRQVGVADTGQLLADKIAYAKQRWGASMFYIDSNEANDIASLQKVQARYPDVLLIPENVTTGEYAYGAPYREVRTNNLGTTTEVRQTYAEAFSAISINDASDAQLAASKAAIQANLKSGDLLLVHWWATSLAKSIYQGAGLMLSRGELRHTRGGR